MEIGLVIWGLVLAFFGLNTALVAWFVLRFTAGPVWALVGFNAILFATCYGIVEIAG